MGHEPVRTGVRQVDEALGRMRALVPGAAPGDPGTADPDLVRAALAELPYDDQQLLWLKHVDAADDYVLADRLGLPLGAVQRRLRHAERKLSAGFAAAHARAAAHASGACATTRASLDDYVRHRMPARARSVLEEHLFGCQDCMRAFIDVRQASWTLRDAAPMLLTGGAGLAAAGHVVVGATGAAASGAGGLLGFLGLGAGVGAVRDRLVDVVREVAAFGTRTTLLVSGATATIVVTAGVVAAVMLSGGGEPVPVTPGAVAPVQAAPAPVASSSPASAAPTPEPSVEPTPVAAVPQVRTPLRPEPPSVPVAPVPVAEPPAALPVAPEPGPEPSVVPSGDPEVRQTEPPAVPEDPEPSPSPEPVLDPEPTETPEPTPTETPEPTTPEATPGPTPTLPAPISTVVVTLPAVCTPGDVAAYAVSLTAKGNGGVLTTRDSTVDVAGFGVLAWRAQGVRGVPTGAWIVQNLTCAAQDVTFTLTKPVAEPVTPRLVAVDLDRG